MNQFNFPRISVIVAVYNREGFIENCLDSVLKQTVDDYEVIVVDDGSMDQTRKILEKYKQHSNVTVFFHRTNRGLMCSRNTGIGLSRGDFIAFTDSDCIVQENWLEELSKPFILNQDIVIVGGKILDPPSKNYWELVNRGSNFIAHQSCYVQEIIGCNMAFRRQFLIENPFDTTFNYCAGDDVDVCFRARQIKKLIYFTNSARVIHYHRSQLKNTLRQQFGYGFMRVYVNLKYSKFPFVNWGTVLIVLSLLLACVGILLKDNLSLKFATMTLLLYLGLILYLCYRSKEGNLLFSLYSFPGQLIASSANCCGNVFYFIRKILNSFMAKGGGPGFYQNASKNI